MEKKKLVFVMLLCLPVVSCFVFVGETHAMPQFTYSHSITTPGSSGQGLASDGMNVFWLDSHDKLIYAYDISTGQSLYSFAAPITTAGLGLAHNGTNLFVIDSSYAGGTGYIYELNPVDGSMVNSFTISGEVTSATFFAGSLYINDGSYMIKELDPTNGSVIAQYATEAAVENGVGIGIHGLTAYGASLIAAVGYEGQCVEIDPSNGDTLSSFHINDFTQGIRGLSSDGTHLFASGIVGYDPDGTSRIDVYTPVPEPATLSLLALGGLALLRKRK